MTARAMWTLGLAALISACGQAPIKLTNSPEFAPVYPVVQTTRNYATGSIYTSGQGDNWYGRGVSYQIGDTVTVLLDETTQATRQQSTSVSRESSNDVMTLG